MASVNYLKTINTFWDEAPYMEGFSPDAVVLFFAVLDTINSSSLNSNWSKTPIQYERIISKCKFGKRAFLSARSWLVDNHFLSIESGKNEYSPAKYFVDDRFVEGLDAKIEIEQSESSQSPPESPPKKEKAKKEIEPKKVWGEYVEGKGDGELHSMMSEFYHKNPDKYEAEMYQEFLRYWTAPIQKGAGKGKEKWRTMDTFQVSGRLATWAKNYKPKETKVNGKPKSEWDASETLREAFAIVEAKYASTG